MTELKKQFRKEHPETVGEKDSEFDLSNYVDWLESKIEGVAIDEYRKDWPLRVALFGGRKRIMLGGAFSSYLSQGVIPVRVQEEIVKTFNKEYHRLKNKEETEGVSLVWLKN